MTLIEHVDWENHDVNNIYMEIVRFMEYFSNTQPTRDEEVVSKSILLKGLGPMTAKMTKEPLKNHRATQEILKELKIVVEQHLRAKYSQQDLPYYNTLIRMQEEIDEAIVEVE